MSEQFSILIDSRTRFETGEPGGVWLSMPTTKEQLHEAMQRVGITADNPQNFFINGFANTEQQPFDVPLPVIQSAGLDELNYLGNLLAMQRDEDRDMDSGELEYIQNGNRRLIADAAIWDWYHRAKTTAKPPARQGG